MRSPDLIANAATLPKLLKSSLCESTLKKYRPAWDKWVGWSKQYPEVNTCPADPFFVALYLNDLYINDASVSRIIFAFCGIKWGHLITGNKSPTDNPFVKMCLEGAKRSIEKTGSGRKEPLTAEIINNLVQTYGSSGNLIDVRAIVFTVLGFSGFFRSSELLHLKVKHLQRTPVSYEVLLEKSKTDQVREGNIVYISATGKETCPVFWVDKYLNETKLVGDDFVFCRLFKTKKGHAAHGDKQLSYDTMRKSFLTHLKTIVGGTEVKKYGLHSLRSGGASAAAENGISDRLISKHGRWSSNTSRDVYIKDSKCKRLKVSSSLGL